MQQFTCNKRIIIILYILITAGCNKLPDKGFTPDSMYKHPESRQTMMDLYTRTFQNWPAPDSSFFVKGRFGDTYVIQWGRPQNDTLILLHGIAGNVMLWGKECIEELSKHFFIIAFETMGDNVGRSIPKRWPLERDTLRVWLNDLFDSMNIRSANIAGHSFGAWLSLDYAIHYQNRVRSLSLLGAAGFCKPKIGFMLKMMYLTMRNSRKTMLQAYSLLHTPEFNRQKHDFEYFWQVYQHCKQVSLFPRQFTSEELSSLHVPVMIAIGTDEHFYNVQKAKVYGKNHIKHSEIHLLGNAGHLAHIDRPDTVSSLIVNFLK